LANENPNVYWLIRANNTTAGGGEIEENLRVTQAQTQEEVGGTRFLRTSKTMGGVRLEGAGCCIAGEVKGTNLGLLPATSGRKILGSLYHCEGDNTPSSGRPQMGGEGHLVPRRGGDQKMKEGVGGEFSRGAQG